MFDIRKIYVSRRFLIFDRSIFVFFETFRSIILWFDRIELGKVGLGIFVFIRGGYRYLLGFLLERILYGGLNRCGVIRKVKGDLAT